MPLAPVAHLRISPKPGLVWIGFLLPLLCPDPSVAQASSDHQITVRVHDLHGENPIDRARVQIIRFPDQVALDQFTDGSGNVHFGVLSSGSYIVRASAPGYRTGESRVDFRRGEQEQVVDIPLARSEKESVESRDATVSRRILRIPDNALREFKRGEKLLNEKKNPRESISAFEHAIELYPEYSDSYFLLGMAHMQTDNSKAAEGTFRKAIELDARRTDTYYPLAMLLFSQKRFGEEKDLLFAAQNVDGSDYRWPFELARCEAQQAHWNEALRYALDAAKQEKAPPKVHLLLSDIYSNIGRHRDAVSELELFVQLDPQSPYVARVREVLPELRRRAASSDPPLPK
jgi:tetratricopeptide (TPR) repeat protein